MGASGRALEFPNRIGVVQQMISQVGITCRIESVDLPIPIGSPATIGKSDEKFDFAAKHPVAGHGKEGIHVILTEFLTQTVRKGGYFEKKTNPIDCLMHPCLRRVWRQIGGSRMATG
ncbi:MAG: hypothetical protein EOS41_27895 [Mesorhizobium sp.]|uniref:hypothetical protein n=1 Tax=Mesorhizobium sp. TaxID=1871066 RepID=UPI000FE8E78D|nr:hypothetical protein [Mesorhizobium sp.]RWE20825.1 MAG: hypothetical protein EOS41_27895 [Mesorhizobium sp.]